MDTQLQGKVVLITGASGGIGSAIAKKFAGEGARVLVHYRHGRARAIALQRELGVESAVIGADLTKEGQVRALLLKAVQRWGRVDTLVANAGAWASSDRPLHRMTLRQWQHTLDSVLTSMFLTLREFMRLVARQKRGNAVVIASTAAIFGEAGHADYAASKAAIAYGLTRSLKNELARLAPHTRQYCGGRINCICPGWTLVPRTAPKLRDAATLRKVAATMALPQIARPEDIANAAVFLSSDALARHITGQAVVVAGGMEGRILWQPQEIDPESV
jgi:3-oxoacyl-[acyl-carrier protein] reductase